MNYLNFHRLCLYTLAEMNPRLFCDTQQVLHSGAQIRVKNISTACEPILRYYRKYNNLEWNGFNPHGLVIDRFVVAHAVESRYAESEWNSFECTFNSVSSTPALEIEALMKNFSKMNNNVMAKINKMHKEKHITHNDFNAQGGNMYGFTYKSFKEIYMLLKNENLI